MVKTSAKKVENVKLDPYQHKIMQHVAYAENLQQQGIPEYSNKSILDLCQENALHYSTYNPNTRLPYPYDWQLRARRPIISNRVIGIAAHATKRVIYPNVFAKNRNNEQDRVAQDIYRLLYKDVVEKTGYIYNFLDWIVGTLLEPYGVMETGYRVGKRTIKEWNADKEEYELKEIIDSEYSGFFFEPIPAINLMFANLFEPNLQLQPFIIKRRYISFTQAQDLFGHYPNFQHVQPGMKMAYIPDLNLARNPELNVTDDYVEHLTYYNRFDDVKVDLVGGVPMQKADQTAIDRMDKQYPFSVIKHAPLGSGSSIIGQPLVSKLAGDELIYNTLTNSFINSQLIDLMPPTIVTGTKKFDQNIFRPGQAVFSENPDVRLQQITSTRDPRAGIAAIREMEASMNQSSQDPSRAGFSASKEMSAYEFAELNNNANIMMGLFGSYVSQGVKQLGELMMSDIGQFLTLPDMMARSDTDQIERYQSFFVTDSGKDYEIRFDHDYFVTNKAKSIEELSLDVMKKEGGLKKERNLIIANPQEIADIAKSNRVKIHIAPDVYQTKSEAVEKALQLEMFKEYLQVPGVDPRKVGEDFINGNLSSGNADRYMQQTQPQMPGMDMMMEQPSQQGRQLGNFVGQLTGSTSLDAMNRQQ